MDKSAKTPSFQAARYLMTDSTLATVLGAAWAMVLASQTGSEDMVFRSTLSGPNAPVAYAAWIFGPTITTVSTRVRLVITLSTSGPAIEGKCNPIRASGHPAISEIGRRQSFGLPVQDIPRGPVASQAQHEPRDDARAFFDAASLYLAEFYTYGLL